MLGRFSGRNDVSSASMRITRRDDSDEEGKSDEERGGLSVSAASAAMGAPMRRERTMSVEERLKATGGIGPGRPRVNVRDLL